MSDGRAAGRRGSIQAGVVDVGFALAALLAVAAAILGGASRENPMRLAAVELCALPLAALSIRRLARERAGGPDAARLPLLVLGAIIAVPLLQLIRLPPAVWTAIPGQGPRLTALHLARLQIPWLPLSLSPDDTGRAALALIPPAAMFVAALNLGAGERRRLAWLWIVLAVAGLALGLAQVAAPGGGPAYPYRTTNVGSLVGLFANRNHEAGYLLALLPFAAALAMPSRGGPSGHGGSSGARADRQAGAPWLAWPFILVAIVALGVIRSRAGLILAAPATIAALAVAWRGRGRHRAGWPIVAIAAAVGVAALAVALFASGPILDRFDRSAPAEFRFEAWPHVIAAAEAFLPLGSGLGSFDRVFESVEPLALVGPTYFNHAHNDYLELWLETGWVGAVVLAVFLAWFIPAAWRAWRGGPALPQAASVATTLLMAQSLVDYPLRTETLAVLFAFCCALLVSPGRPRP